MGGDLRQFDLGHGRDRIGASFLVADLILVAGTQNITLPESGYKAIGLVVTNDGTNPGFMAVTIAADTLTVSSSNALDDGSVSVLCMKGGGPRIVVP